MKSVWMKKSAAIAARAQSVRAGVLFALLTGVFSSPSTSAATAKDLGLADLSLNELANISITSVSKKSEPLADAAASVYVITADDIRRSGATSLPEALRLAPNLQVAQINALQWAITARGTNATSADKLLVLIDGRIVYTPLYSGVFWDAQNVMLEDVDRIEVISGPGGTLWGTNAVNGVINIITRKAQDTPGLLVTAGGGRPGTGAAVRYGGHLENGGDYRIYGHVFDRYDTSTSMGNPASDDWNMSQLGFRSDWSGEDRQFTLQGDTYQGSEAQRLPGRATLSGTNLLSHWQNKLEGGSALSLLAYYDETRRYEPGLFGETLNIADLEFQQSFPAISSQNIIWGASYRYAQDDVQNLNGASLAFLPAQAELAWTSLFSQDEIDLNSHLRLILGGRLEHNPYTGTDFLPNARLAWNVAPDSLLWTAASRVVRAPSRLDTDLYAPGQPPYTLVGNPDFQSETANVYEIGYRAQPQPAWSYSITGYHYDYSHLRTVNLASSGALTLGNDMTAKDNGIELWGSYQPLSNWRLSAGFTGLREQRTLSGNALPSSINSEGNDPATQWFLRSSYDFAGGEQLDLIVRRIAALPNPAIPAYTAADLRVGWTLGDHITCSVVARNLFGPPHIEFGNPATASEFGRGLYARLSWHP